MHRTILSPFELGDNLCDILDKVRSIPGKKTKTKTWKTFLSQWEVKLIATVNLLLVIIKFIYKP